MHPERKVRLMRRVVTMLTSAMVILASAPSVARSLRADGIAAIVGDQTILLSDVHVRMLLLSQQQQTGMRSSGDRELEHQALEELIEETLVAREAVRMEISVTAEEVENTIETMAQQNNMDMEAFRSALETQGMTMVEYRRNIRRELLTYKTMNMRIRGRVNINEEAAREFYNDQVRSVRRTAWFEGAHILVRIPPGSRAVDVARARERAVSLQEQIVKGLDFEEAAMAASEDTTTALRGGRLGRLMPGVIPGVLDRVFLDMEVGEVSMPIRTSAGFHLLWLSDREDLGVQSFDAVKQLIMGQLTQREMDRQHRIWVRELRQRAYIQIRL